MRHQHKLEALLVIVVVVLIVLLMGQLGAQTPDQIDLEGAYLASGLNADGNEYGAILEIKQRGDVVHARWTYPRGEPTYGIGFMREGVLILGYHGGAAVYRVVNGTLTEGQWVSGDGTKVMIERLEPLPDHPAPDVAPAKPKPSSRVAVAR